MEGLVSIIVTCYNHEKYIEQCLESILAQTYKNIELLVINDGSMDKSDELIKKVLTLSTFQRSEYISQENSGVSITRNKGLEWLKGEYVLFVDSDNYLDENYVEHLVYTAKEFHADIVYTDLNNAETQEVFMEAKEFDLPNYLASNFIDNCSLIRTTKIGTIKYDLELNRKKLVDYDFLMSLILVNNAKPVKCHTTKLNYRILENSISRKGNHSSEKFYYEVYLYILSKHFNDYPEMVTEAIKTNIFILENRLDELLSHLNDVTALINSKDEDNINLIQEISSLKEQVIQNKNERHLLLKELKQANEVNEDMQEKTETLETTVSNLEAIIAALENEKSAILNSRSYKVGNFLIKPVNYGVRIIKHPVLLKEVLKKIKNFLMRKISKIPSPRSLLLKFIRNIERYKNNYSNPKRILVYVIYGDGNKLQRYKVLFLEALSKLTDEVLIVVNGNLESSDVKELQNFGHIEIRNNVGYDTAAFRHGIQYLGKKKLQEYDELLLVNDTNVGPVADLEYSFEKMAKRRLDFWGISYGEEQPDFTQFNKYGFIPEHLQSYFLVIEKSMLHYSGFYEYWDKLEDTNSRNKAIGKHETVFTKHFADLGFKHGALAKNNVDSPMYIHPLQMVKEGIPLIKYTAFSNFNNDKFAWQGLLRETEIPELIEYLKTETNYPMSIIDQIMHDVRNKKVKEHILIIDGVENAIPQLTKYRVQNKVEQLKNLGYDVWCVNLSDFQMGYAEHASHIIIYRAPFDPKLLELIKLARKYDKPVLYDIDDLVIDTEYTDQLSYVKNISKSEKAAYDAGVISYGKMLKLCDGAIASTGKLKEELLNYQNLVLLNRNLASDELVKISQTTVKEYEKQSTQVKIGYFSGSITHNENFELIKPAITKLLKNYSNIELHIVGHLDIPEELNQFKNQIVNHPFVDWRELPQLISQIDINLAPLVNSIFNQAKSEIKWLEASLVKVPTIASEIGSFKEMIQDGKTGILVKDDEWYEELERLALNFELRKELAESAYIFVVENCTTNHHKDELTDYIRSKNYEADK